jgi:hypothetical protein
MPSSPPARATSMPMLYRIRHPAVIPDVEVVHEAMIAADSTADLGVVRSGSTLRVSTSLTSTELETLLFGAGLSVNAQTLEPLLSECCGGCGS